MHVPALILTLATLTAAPFCGAAVAADAPPAAVEWQVNVFTKSTQSEATIAARADGGVSVMWSSRRQQGGRYGVYSRSFAADGAALGGEETANLWTASHQRGPALSLAGERGWAAWESHGQDAEAGAIIARRLAGGALVGDELLVNGDGRGHQQAPVVASWPDGSAVVAWTSRAATDAAPRVELRRLDALGRPAGEVTSVFGLGAGTQTPSVAVHADGSFAVACTVVDERLLPARVAVACFDADGEPIGVLRALPLRAAERGLEPVLRATRDGFVVAWLAADAAAGQRVVAARLDCAGTLRDTPFLVHADAAAWQNGAALAVADDGRIAVAYNRIEHEEQDVYARLFTADGVACGPPLRVNRHAEGDQTLRAGVGTQRLVFTRAGGLACVWSGRGAAESSGVFVTHVPLSGPFSERSPQGLAAALEIEQDAARPEPHRPPVFDRAAVEAGAREIVELDGGDVGFTGVINTGWNPPDPHLAVGPEHVVVMTNGAIAFFTKDGAQTFQDQIEGAAGFWGGVGASTFVFDPEVVYDPASERFFAMASDDAPAGLSFILLAVSDDADPNGVWAKYRLSTTALVGDQYDSPNISVGADVVYFTGDQGGGGPVYGLLAIDKASVLAGDPPAITSTAFVPTSTESAAIPPVVFDDPPALYMVEHGEAGVNFKIRLIALTDPLGTPTFDEFFVPVPAYGPPEDPPHAGSGVRPQTFDARFWSSAYRNGSLWATHHINQSRVVVRWYEIAMNGWPLSGDTPELVQAGDIDPAPTVRTFFSSITVDDFGTAVLCYARSSPTEPLSMETAFRFKSDPLGTFRPGTTWIASTGSFSGSRWGDYSAVNVDPVNGKTFWAHHEYALSGSWRTWIQSFTPPYPTGDLDCDGLVGFVDLLGLLAAWGPCPPDGPCAADLDASGDVGFADLLTLLASWGGVP